jgi:HPt (histidine-containing phosphotransfer) domain-containing protein
MHIERAALDPVLDIRGALSRLDGDEGLLVDLMGFFLEDSVRLMEELRAATAAGDANQIKMTGHALKGLIAGCGGVRAAEAAKRVEHAAAANDLSQIKALVDTLASELERAQNEARGYLS